MSVINKMLRDLDSRQATGTTPSEIQSPRAGLMRGTLIMRDSEQLKQPQGTARRAVLIAAIVLVGGVAAAWWFWIQHVPRQSVVEGGRAELTTTPQALSVATPQAAVLVPSPATDAPALAVASEVTPLAQQKKIESQMVVSSVSVAAEAANKPLKVTLVMTPSIAGLPVPVPVPVPVPLPLPLPRAAKSDFSLDAESTFKGTQRPEMTAGPDAGGAAQAVPRRSSQTVSNATVSAVTMTASSRVSHSSPALQALAQAQSVWNSGSHAPAIELLREVLTAAERENLGRTPADNHWVLAVLARELARMELEEGREAQALEMLTRLEPVLSGVADIWAIRGNAAQRLGLNQESAAAYLRALKLRPDEPRWMLGAAVSLAAQGQTTSAAELAEKARTSGALSPEVATYLRRLGVTLRER